MAKGGRNLQTQLQRARNAGLTPEQIADAAVPPTRAAVPPTPPPSKSKGAGRLVKTGRSHPNTKVAVGAGAAAAAGGAGMYAYLRNRSRPKKPPTEASPSMRQD